MKNSNEIAAAQGKLGILLVGLGAGIISFIPYVGAATGLIVGLAIALAQFSDWAPIVYVGLIFIIGQTTESYILTPRLVGDRIGLHPVWIIFALLAGGALLGFTGVLLAVPAAAQRRRSANVP